jgi:hypothetical protein
MLCAAPILRRHVWQPRTRAHICGGRGRLWKRLSGWLRLWLRLWASCGHGSVSRGSEDRGHGDSRGRLLCSTLIDSRTESK